MGLKDKLKGLQPASKTLAEVAASKLASGSKPLPAPVVSSEAVMYNGKEYKLVGPADGFVGLDYAAAEKKVFGASLVAFEDGLREALEAALSCKVAVKVSADYQNATVLYVKAKAAICEKWVAQTVSVEAFLYAGHESAVKLVSGSLYKHLKEAIAEQQLDWASTNWTLPAKTLTDLNVTVDPSQFSPTAIAGTLAGTMIDPAAVSFFRAHMKNGKPLDITIAGPAGSLIFKDTLVVAMSVDENHPPGSPLGVFQLMFCGMSTHGNPTGMAQATVAMPEVVTGIDYADAVAKLQDVTYPGVPKHLMAGTPATTADVMKMSAAELDAAVAPLVENAKAWAKKAMEKPPTYVKATTGPGVPSFDQFAVTTSPAAPAEPVVAPKPKKHTVGAALLLKAVPKKRINL